MDITQTRYSESIMLTFEIENTHDEDVLTVSYSKRRYLPTRASVAYTRDRHGDEWCVSELSLRGIAVLKNGGIGNAKVTDRFLASTYRNDPESLPEWLVRLVKGSVPR